MGVENNNFDGDADMQGGVVQSDAAAEDPGPETKSRRAVSLFYFITHVGTCVYQLLSASAHLTRRRVVAYIPYHLEVWPLS